LTFWHFFATIAIVSTKNKKGQKMNSAEIQTAQPAQVPATHKEAALGALGVAEQAVNSSPYGIDEHGNVITKRDHDTELAYRQAHGHSSDESATKV